MLFIEQGQAIASRRVREGVSRTYGLFGPGEYMVIHAYWAGMLYPTDALALGDGLHEVAGHVSNEREDRIRPDALVLCGNILLYQFYRLFSRMLMMAHL